MLELKEIRNAENADSIRKKINGNFKKVSQHFSSRVLSVSDEEMNTMSQDFVRDGLVIYNTTRKMWFKRSGNEWVEYKFYHTYKTLFSKTDWESGKIIIPYVNHNVDVKDISVYMDTSEGYKLVCVDCVIDSHKNVILESDYIFSGMVVLS